jgi:hypothetical protein
MSGIISSWIIRGIHIFVFNLYFDLSRAEVHPFNIWDANPEQGNLLAFYLYNLSINPSVVEGSNSTCAGHPAAAMFSLSLCRGRREPNEARMPVSSPNGI